MRGALSDPDRGHTLIRAVAAGGGMEFGRYKCVTACLSFAVGQTNKRGSTGAEGGENGYLRANNIEGSMCLSAVLERKANPSNRLRCTDYTIRPLMLRLFFVQD